jgi:hypothetical protein
MGQQDAGTVLEREQTEEVAIEGTSIEAEKEVSS